ncbi:MAG TPA: hypothetical protein VMA37_08780 [Acetobacteraceae bacterium]|nr:hypothetical protein [Acetobacteraceae bacterium]
MNDLIRGLVYERDPSGKRVFVTNPDATGAAHGLGRVDGIYRTRDGAIFSVAVMLDGGFRKILDPSSIFPATAIATRRCVPRVPLIPPCPRSGNAA